VSGHCHVGEVAASRNPLGLPLRSKSRDIGVGPNLTKPRNFRAGAMEPATHSTYRNAKAFGCFLVAPFGFEELSLSGWEQLEECGILRL
jgi:hypothetical protein